MLVSRALLEFIFIRLLRQCFTSFQDSFSTECYVSISRTFGIPFHPSITLVSRFLGSSRIRLIPEYAWKTTINGPFLEIWGIVYHSKDSSRSKTVVGKRLLTVQSSSSSDCYVSVSRLFRIPFQPSVTLVSRALSGFLFIRVLRQYLVHFQDFCSSDCYISVSNTLEFSLFNCSVCIWIVMLASRALLEISFIPQLS